MQNNNELLQEQMLLERINRLPEFIQSLVGEFSPVVANQKALVKCEFFDKWVDMNTDRILALMDGWSKHHIGFVLNSIVKLDNPNYRGLCKGGGWYNYYTANQMRRLIKIEINRRTRHMRPDVINDIRIFKQNRIVINYWRNPGFVPCKINTAFDNYLPIRIYGAYKAIEEYNTRLLIKKNKK